MENMVLKDKIFKKNLGNYLIRLFLFVITIKYCFIIVSFLLFIVLYPITFPLSKLIEPIVVYIQNNWDFFVLYETKEDAFLNSVILVSSCIGMYFFAKIFGVFKKLNKVNLIGSLLILYIISVALIYIGKIKILTPSYIHILGINYSYTMYLLIPAYLVYLFFNFLTKKFPTPFKQIGYFFSVEFYKDLCRKIINKFKTSD